MRSILCAAICCLSVGDALAAPDPASATAAHLPWTTEHFLVIGLLGVTAVFAVMAAGIWFRWRATAQAAETLRESEARYRKVVEQSADAILILDGERIVYVNPAAVRMFATTRGDDLTGREIAEFIADEDRGKASLLCDARSGPMPVEDYPTIRFRQLDSGEFIGACNSIAIEWEGSRAVQISIRNITRQIQARQALRDSEERFTAFIENSPAAIFMKDLQGRYRMGNRRFREWYAGNRLDPTGLTAADLFPPSRTDSYVDQDREVIASMKAVEREHDLLFADGTDHRVVATKFPILDSTGRPIGIGAINTDITEHRKMEARLRQSQRMEAVGRLTGGVAHEFNNLLQVILGNLEMIEGRLSDDELRRAASVMCQSARRGAELTQQLLAFSRNQTLEVRRIELPALMSNVADMLSRTLGENISLDVDLPGPLWPIAADIGQTECALLNLAINARDAMPDGGIISVRAENLSLNEDAANRAELAPGDYVALSIRDIGAGMTPDVLEHVFEPFYTTKDIGKGTGLGLSMVYGFAKQSMGGVEIESMPGEGTTVTLYLPRAEHQVPSGEATASDTACPTGNHRILMVEDEPEVRDVLVGMLGDLGYDVEQAADGATALAALETGERFDLLFTDIVLPGGVSGLELWRRARSRQPGIRVLFTSGYSDETIRRGPEPDDGLPFIRKPFSRGDLAQTVRNAIGPRNDRAEPSAG